MNLQQMCRTCLQSGGELYSLFNSKVNMRDLNQFTPIDLLQLFIPISITDDDRYPDQLCKDCLTEVRRLYDFRMKCLKSETIIKQLKCHTELIIKKEESNEVIRIDSSPSPSPSPELHNFIDEIRIKNELIIDDTENYERMEFYSGDEVIAGESSNSLHGRNHIQVRADEDDDVSFVDEGDEGIQKLLIEVDKQTKNARPSQTKNGQDCVDPSDFALLKILQCVNCRNDVVSRECFQSHIAEKHMDIQFCRICKEAIKDNNIQHYTKHLTVQYKLYKYSDLLEYGLCHCQSKTHKFRLQCPQKDASGTSSNCQTCTSALNKPNYLVKKFTSINCADLECEVCMKKFHHVIELYMHMQNHIKDKEFQCGFCSKVFNRKDHLKLHTRAHTGERPWKCQFCSKIYRQKNCLHYHMAREHPEKSKQVHFECDACLRKFWYKSVYLTHSRQTAFDGPVNCDICQRTCKNRNCLRAHIKTVHNDNALTGKFECSECLKSFAEKSHLIQHMLWKHSKEAEA